MLLQETRSSCRITDQRDATFPAAPRELFTPPSRGDPLVLADAVLVMAVTTMHDDDDDGGDGDGFADGGGDDGGGGCFSWH